MRSSRSMMAGAASHMALTGVWVGEEVAAVDGVRRSASRLCRPRLEVLSGVDAPWAQTEWERLTGTMENRSTVAACFGRS